MRTYVAGLAFVAFLEFFVILAMLFAGNYLIRHYLPFDPWPRWVTIGAAVAFTVIAFLIAYNDGRIDDAPA